MTEPHEHKWRYLYDAIEKRYRYRCIICGEYREVDDAPRS